MAKATAPAAEAQPAARAVTPAVERPASHDATETMNSIEAEFFSSAAPHAGLAAQGTGNSRPLLRAVINRINRYCMVPAFRLGLAPILGTPLGGYIMVLKTRGRKSGRLRYAPLN